MSIRIERNDAGNCITFVGSTNPAYWNACLSAEEDATATGTVNIINDLRTQIEGVDIYEFYRIPYQTFLDADGNSFEDIATCVVYINTNANVLSSSGTSFFGATDTIDLSFNSVRNGVLVDNGDAFLFGEVQAVARVDGNIDVVRHSGDKVIYSGIVPANVTIEGGSAGASQTDVVDNMNARFLGQGGALAAPDLSTLPSTVNLLTNTNFIFNSVVDPASPPATEFAYANLPSGVYVTHSDRSRLSGSIATPGTYNVDITGINAFGTDTQTVSFVVANPTALDNNYSFQTDANYYFQSTAAALSTLFSSAWSFSAWIRPTSSNNKNQTIMVFGPNDELTSRFNLLYDGKDERIKIRLGLGGNNQDHWEQSTPISSVSNNTWTHVAVVWDATGVLTGDFKVYINGTLATLSLLSSSGTAAAVSDWDEFRLGRCVVSTGSFRGGLIDEAAVWSSALTAGNITTLYNSRTMFDYLTMSPAPAHWWRLGDGFTFPTSSDQIGTTDLTLVNGTPLAIIASAFS